MYLLTPNINSLLTNHPGPPRPQPQRDQRVRASWNLAGTDTLPKTNTNFHIRIARTAGNQVLTAGGVVRGLTNWGTFLLPKPARKQGAVYHNGHYFIMRFDSSAKTQHAVKRTLGLDPRMIRYSMVKVGEKLDEVKDVSGQVPWLGRK